MSSETAALAASSNSSPALRMPYGNTQAPGERKTHRAAAGRQRGVQQHALADFIDLRIGAAAFAGPRRGQLQAELRCDPGQVVLRAFLRGHRTVLTAETEEARRSPFRSVRVVQRAAT